MSDNGISIVVTDKITHNPVNIKEYQLRINHSSAPIDIIGGPVENGRISIKGDYTGQILYLAFYSQAKQKMIALDPIKITKAKMAFHVASPEKVVPFNTDVHEGDPSKNEDTSLPEFKKSGVLTLQQFLDHYGPYLTGEKKVLGERDKNGNPITMLFGIGNKIINYPDNEVTDQEYRDAADALDVEVNVIKALAHVESQGKGFLPCGIPKILYERKVVYEGLTKKKFIFTKDNEDHELAYNAAYSSRKGKTDDEWKEISSKDKYLSDLDSWRRLCQAYKLGYSLDVLINSVSWGRLQIVPVNIKDSVKK